MNLIAATSDVIIGLVIAAWLIGARDHRGLLLPSVGCAPGDFASARGG